MRYCIFQHPSPIDEQTLLQNNHPQNRPFIAPGISILAIQAAAGVSRKVMRTGGAGSNLCLSAPSCDGKTKLGDANLDASILLAAKVPQRGTTQGKTSAASAQLRLGCGTDT